MKTTAADIRKLIRWCVACGRKVKAGVTTCEGCKQRLIKKRN